MCDFLLLMDVNTKVYKCRFRWHNPGRIQISDGSVDNSIEAGLVVMIIDEDIIIRLSSAVMVNGVIAGPTYCITCNS